MNAFYQKNIEKNKDLVEHLTILAEDIAYFIAGRLPRSSMPGVSMYVSIPFGAVCHGTFIFYTKRDIMHARCESVMTAHAMSFEY